MSRPRPLHPSAQRLKQAAIALAKHQARLERELPTHAATQPSEQGHFYPYTKPEQLPAKVETAGTQQPELASRAASKRPALYQNEAHWLRGIFQAVWPDLGAMRSFRCMLGADDGGCSCSTCFVNSSACLHVMHRCRLPPPQPASRCLWRSLEECTG
jgi:hypothetical protein